MLPRPRVTWLVALAVLLGACLTQPSGPQTWIGIYGPQDASLPEEMRLEVGDAAWGVGALSGGGVVTPALDEPAFVRLIGVNSCRTYASFEASPGSAYTIRFGADGPPEVTDITGDPTEMGPGLVDAPLTSCPRG